MNIKLDIPRKVIIKTMTVNRRFDDMFDFFEDPKSMETGGSEVRGKERRRLVDV